MHLQVFISCVFISIFGFLTKSISGANLKYAPTPKTPAVPPTIPDGLSIENLQVSDNSNRRGKTPKEPISVILTTTPPTPTSSSTVYRLNGNNGAACILIRTDGLLSFQYTTNLGEKREGDAFMPDNYQASGNCEDADEAFITITWKTYKWSIYFSKTPGGEHWYVSNMELVVGSDERVFEHINRKPSVFRFTLSKERKSMLFPTPVGKAFTCSEESSVELRDRDVIATVFLRDLKMQPFIFKKDDFGPEYICSPGAKSFRDETAPIAVGSTLAIVTLLTVTGYGVYRYIKVKKVQYNTME